MLNLIDNGLSFSGNGLSYAWFALEKAGRKFYRCVALRELAVIPVSERENYDLLGKQWAAVRGLHNAGVNFVYSSLGIFNPDHIGIVQYFGAAGEGDDEESAATIALRGLTAVESVMANFPQSKLAPPNPDYLRWYLDFITSKSRIAAILGHPDPREGSRGGMMDGGLEDDSKADLASEQNEILFRGLAKIRQNFIFQVLAEHISRGDLTKTLIRVSETVSNVASRRRGSVGIGFSLGIPLMAALSQSHASGIGSGTGTSHAESSGTSHSWGETDSVSHSHSTGTTTSEGQTHTTGHGTSESFGTTHTESSASSRSVSSGTSQSHGGGSSHGDSWGVGVNKQFDLPIVGKFNVGVNRGWSDTTSSFSSVGSFQSVSSSSMSGESFGTSHSTSTSAMESSGASRVVSHSESSSTSVGHAKSESWGESQAHSTGTSQTASRTLASGLSSGVSTGLLPGVNISRTWQTEDDVAERLTDVLRRLESLVNQASAEGGFMTNAFLFTENEAGMQAGEALVPQAFHGPSVATPVLTIQPEEGEVEQLRAHAFAFVPWNDVDDGDPFGGDLWTKYATLVTSSQLAAYTAPGLFEEGTAATTMPAIPKGLGFYPNMPGDIIIGHQYSPETGDLTTAQVRLDQSMLMHTIFAGDTGFGKSVAAIRMAYETTLKWHCRTIALDFGAGWRSLLNAPGLEGHVDIRQLQPDAVRPLRWNPLQSGAISLQRCSGGRLPMYLAGLLNSAKSVKNKNYWMRFVSYIYARASWWTTPKYASRRSGAG